MVPSIPIIIEQLREALLETAEVTLSPPSRSIWELVLL
ncbi:hypothetical protein LINPERHAP2_LOCUS40160 [Linum perenne]